jgi:hypothetical protein
MHLCRWSWNIAYQWVIFLGDNFKVAICFVVTNFSKNNKKFKKIWHLSYFSIPDLWKVWKKSSAAVDTLQHEMFLTLRLESHCHPNFFAFFNLFPILFSMVFYFILRLQSWKDDYTGVGPMLVYTCFQKIILAFTQFDRSNLISMLQIVFPMRISLNKKPSIIRVFICF